MYYLIQRFTEMDEHNGKDTYKAVERIFYEQCKVHEEAVTVKQKTGGSVMQNPPTRREATYDGHKGPDYQAQVAETCNSDKEAQLITCVIPQTSACAKIRQIVYERAYIVTIWLDSSFLRSRFVDQTTRRRPGERFSFGLRKYADLSRFPIALWDDF